MGEPGIDHPRLGYHTEIVDGELAERPAAIAVGSRADLKDDGLAALARERAEVVVHVVNELEVNERLRGRRDAPVLFVSADMLWTQHIAGVPVHRDDRAQRPPVLPIYAEQRRGRARVIPTRPP